MDYEKIIKIVQGISFTTFLILCVAFMSYAVVHLYTDNRTDWNQVQVNTQNIERLTRDVETLLVRMDKLIEQMQVCLRPARPASADLSVAQFNDFLTPTPTVTVKTTFGTCGSN